VLIVDIARHVIVQKAETPRSHVGGLFDFLQRDTSNRKWVRRLRDAIKRHGVGGS
jgi:hypothetical protein